MPCIYPITDDMSWVGGNDRRLALFENQYPISRGISYNAYVINDEKTVLIDTVDQAIADSFFDNLAFALGGRPLDYVIINHMEPDHSATLGEVLSRYPSATIVCNAKTAQLIGQFFEMDLPDRLLTVTEADTLCTGRHTFAFRMAPMVHWPEVMVTYDTVDRVLYSADAFGTFGALSGSVFADDVDFEREWLPDARRYYTNIVGKYGTQTQALLKKISVLDVAMLCPLHGPVWRKNIAWFIDKYQKWSTYTPEENGVVIAYASVYGHTAAAAEQLAVALSKRGVRCIRVYDVSATHPSVILADVFRFSHLVLASVTYNNELFVNMETLVRELISHNLQNRTVALLENGSWAPTAGKLLREALASCKNLTVVEQTLTLKSCLKAAQLPDLHRLAQALVDTMPVSPALSTDAIDPTALFKLSYGLFVLSAAENGKDNGCIINTASQVTDNPKQLSITVNKANLTHDMIAHTGMFNLSVLTTDAPFSLFEQFGFHSGRNTDKFEATPQAPRSANGVRYCDTAANALLSCRVVTAQDVGTHTVFIAEVTEAQVLSDAPSVTYAYYFEHIKPKPQPTKKKGFICKICGYVHEGDTLPEDFICPICKHGVADFEPLGK